MFNTEPHHELISTNEYKRVVEVTLHTGTVYRIHLHDNGNVLYRVLRNGGTSARIPSNNANVLATLERIALKYQNSTPEQPEKAHPKGFMGLVHRIFWSKASSSASGHYFT